MDIDLDSSNSRDDLEIAARKRAPNDRADVHARAYVQSSVLVTTLYRALYVYVRGPICPELSRRVYVNLNTYVHIDHTRGPVRSIHVDIHVWIHGRVGGPTYTYVRVRARVYSHGI